MLLRSPESGLPPEGDPPNPSPRDRDRLPPLSQKELQKGRGLSSPLPPLPVPAQPAHHVLGCRGQERQGCRIRHYLECLHPPPLPFHLPWPLSRTPSCHQGPQQGAREAGLHSVHLGIGRPTRARPEGGGHLWEREAGLGGMWDVRADSVGWPQSPWTLPEGWASSRRLRSVSRRASVRSRWLMRAVSTGGHEGREAGLSESWARQGRSGE